MWQPHFLTDGSLIDGAINEILTVTPEANPSVDPNIRGVDPTAYYPDLYPVVVVIMDPGSYSLAMDSTAQTTILATGNWWVYGTPRETWDVLYVAWRFPPGKLPLLPALNHELTHRLTRDPLANHQ